MKKMMALLGLLGACASAGSQQWKPSTALDSHDDPALLRPGYGNAALHTWWPLTEPETAALHGVDQARQGETHALLALALLASGDQRDAGSYASARRRVDQFVSDLRPVMDAAADEWHRGYELHRAMHRVFFRGGNTDLGGYEFTQSRVTSIFTDGRYNCLSSAMLFAVLARAFDLPVRAAVVPTHVFTEMGAPGGKIIEVETTSGTGFDWVHDEKFYGEQAADWSNRRGLRPVTLAEYQRRAIGEPYQLMALGMRNAHVGESAQDRARLFEVAARVNPVDGEAQTALIQTYINEAHDLLEAKAWRTMVKLFDTVRPAVSAIGAGSKDAKTLELVSWATWFHAQALMVVGRPDEAMPLMSEGLDHIDASWADAGKLRNNYLNVFNGRLGDFISKKDYSAAAKLFIEHRDACRSENVCAGNAAVVYLNWSIEHQNAGDWQSARQVLRECVTELPGDGRCPDALRELEGRHRF